VKIYLRSGQNGGSNILKEICGTYLSSICWGVWIATNRSIFQDKETQVPVTAIQIVSIYSSIPEPEDNKTPRQDKGKQIKEGIPWAYFDGASQNNRAGAGIVIHVNEISNLKLQLD